MANISFSSNSSTWSDLPPMPSYTLSPLEPTFSWISDFAFTLLLPTTVYWVFSMMFHFIDIYDLFPQYRLHTPAEILQRNHISRYECARDVITAQLIQLATGAVMGLTEPEEMSGKADYDVAWYATQLRIAQRALPQLLGFVGLNAAAISKNIAGSHPMLAGMLAGGKYPALISGLDIASGAPVPAFASWEVLAAKAIYWLVIPALQFGLAVFMFDTWQYFLHRGMHMNKWLYTTFHARHHRLYVPYAYGALYQHPFEGFLLDTLGSAVAYKLTGMTQWQGAFFFTFSTMKTVDDHCGYKFPWDPLQYISGNNAAYHDIHHQSWGMKTNFSQPYFTIWDRFFGTIWKGGDTTARYERMKQAAQLKAEAEKVKL